MDNKTKCYERPKCSVVELVVEEEILTTSGLDQDKFTLDSYDDLTDVKW